MTYPSKRWLLAPAILVVLWLSFLLSDFKKTSRAGLFPPLPTPNGFDDFQRGARLLTGDAPVKTNSTPEELRAWIGQNPQALEAVHDGLRRPCQVPFQFSPTHLAAHMNELTDFKKLAQLLVVAGRLAEADQDKVAAVEAYLDAIRLAHETARGGLIIDVLCAQGAQAPALKHLRQLRDDLSSSESHRIIQALEAIEGQDEALERTFQRERAYFRKVHGWWLVTSPRLVSIFTGIDPLKKANQETEVSILRGKAQLRLLVVHLALHDYKLEHERYPESLTALVPKCMSALPKDPFGGMDLVYRLEKESYRLYSVGPDRKDDGGTPLGPRTSGQVAQGDIILD